MSTFITNVLCALASFIATVIVTLKLDKCVILLYQDILQNTAYGIILSVSVTHILSFVDIIFTFTHILVCVFGELSQGQQQTSNGFFSYHKLFMHAALAFPTVFSHNISVHVNLAVRLRNRVAAELQMSMDGRSDMG